MTSEKLFVVLGKLSTIHIGIVALEYCWIRLKEGHGSSAAGEDYSEASFCFVFLQLSQQLFIYCQRERERETEGVS